MQQQLLATGAQPLWINPLTEQIATAWTSSITDPRDPGDPPSRPVPAHLDGPGLGIAVDDLHRWTLTATDGVMTPTLAVLTDNAAGLHAARTATAARRIAELATWAESDLRHKVTARYGTVPWPLNQPMPTDLAIYAAPEHWRCLLYGDLVLAQQPTTTLTLEQCRGLLYRLGIDDTARQSRSTAAIVAFLDQLAAAGCVKVHRRHGRVVSVTVVADLETVQAQRDEQLRQRQERDAIQRRTTEHRYRRLQLEVEDRANRRHPSTVAPTGAAGSASAAGWSLRCDVCGNRLSPDQQRAGRQSFCSPERSPQ